MTTGTEPTIDVCDACNGTGIEEGREWDGHPCAECKGTKFITIDDSEPGDPDGECFRGGEYESALAESQARIQRELK